MADLSPALSIRSSIRSAPLRFLMQISAALVHQYQELYRRYDTPEYRERIDEIIATVKARGFRPSQLDAESEAPAAEKGGPKR